MKNIKKTLGLIIGVMIIGSLVGCGSNDEKEKTVQQMKVSEENYTIETIEGEEVRYVNNFIYNMYSSNLKSRFDRYEGANEIKKDDDASKNMYVGDRNGKYGKNTFYYKADSVSTVEKSSLATLKYDYKFDKDKVNESLKIEDTEIIDFISTITDKELSAEDLGKFKEKFEVFKTSDEGELKLRVNPDNNYFSIIMDFDNVKKVIRTTISIEVK